jgi:hypothetical protein
MSDVLSMPWKRLVEQVEVAAAGGNDRAASLLRKLLEHEAADGDLEARSCASPAGPTSVRRPSGGLMGDRFPSVGVTPPAPDPSMSCRAFRPRKGTSSGGISGNASQRRIWRSPAPQRPMPDRGPEGLASGGAGRAGLRTAPGCWGRRATSGLHERPVPGYRRDAQPCGFPGGARCKRRRCERSITNHQRRTRNERRDG